MDRIIDKAVWPRREIFRVYLKTVNTPSLLVIFPVFR